MLAKRERGGLMAAIMRPPVMPHTYVYTRLGVSKNNGANGIGVFAIRLIKKGENPFLYGDTPIGWIKDNALQGLLENIRKLYEDFGILRTVEGIKEWGVPPNFNAMTPIWYLAHSSNPNMRCTGPEDDYQFITLRDIEPGEELTVDYSTFSEDCQRE